MRWGRQRSGGGGAVSGAQFQISAPTLAVEASDDSLAQWHGGAYTLQDYHQRLASVRDCRVAVVEDAAHMLHHDQPLQLARLVEEFLG